MPVKVYTEHGIEFRHEELPEGMVEVDVYTQHHTICPDNGHKHAKEIRQVLNHAGITALCLTTHRKRAVVAVGSGPGGRVRFGDDMMHSTYRVAVRQGDEAAAQTAIAAHKEAVRRWLHEGAEMPEACRQH